MNFIFPNIGNVIIPTDELIFFRGVGQPPTRIPSTKNDGSDENPSDWELRKLMASLVGPPRSEGLLWRGQVAEGRSKASSSWEWRGVWAMKVVDVLMLVNQILKRDLEILSSLPAVDLKCQGSIGACQGWVSDWLPGGVDLIPHGGGKYHMDWVDSFIRKWWSRWVFYMLMIHDHSSPYSYTFEWWLSILWAWSWVDDFIIICAMSHHRQGQVSVVDSPYCVSKLGLYTHLGGGGTSIHYYSRDLYAIFLQDSHCVAYSICLVISCSISPLYPSSWISIVVG